jgi:hypothetical protein
MSAAILWSAINARAPSSRANSKDGEMDGADESGGAGEGFSGPACRPQNVTGES